MGLCGGDVLSYDCTAVVTSTVAAEVVTPPGPLAVKLYVVVCFAETVFLANDGTGLMSLISASIVSAEAHFN